MRFRIVGHPDLEDQVPKVFAADPKRGPVAVARIRGLLESFDEDPMDLEPAPVARSETAGVPVSVQRAGEARPSAINSSVVVYIYEVWAMRFAIARVELPSGDVLAGWLSVEPQSAAASGIATRHLGLALLNKVEELLWAI